jgi:hypothetical protein
MSRNTQGSLKKYKNGLKKNWLRSSGPKRISGRVIMRQKEFLKKQLILVTLRIMRTAQRR